VNPLKLTMQKHGELRAFQNYVKPTSSLLPTSVDGCCPGERRRVSSALVLLALCSAGAAVAAAGALVAAGHGGVPEVGISFGGVVEEGALNEPAWTLNETAAADEAAVLLAEELMVDVSFTIEEQEMEAEPTVEIAVGGLTDVTMNETASAADVPAPLLATASIGTGNGNAVPLMAELAANDEPDIDEERSSEDVWSGSNESGVNTTMPTQEIGEETPDQGDDSERGVVVSEEEPGAEKAAEKPALHSSEEAGAFEEEPEVVFTGEIKTIVKVVSSLILGHVAVPHIPHERRALITSIEESAASAVSSSLSQGDVVEKVNVVCFGGQPLAASRPCLRAPQSRRGSRPSAMYVELEAILVRVCPADQCDGENKETATGLSSASNIQAALRKSGYGALRGATVRNYSLLDSEGRCEESFPFQLPLSTLI